MAQTSQVNVISKELESSQLQPQPTKVVTVESSSLSNVAIYDLHQGKYYYYYLILD